MIYAENILLCIALPLLLTLVFVYSEARGFVIAFLTGMLVCLLAAYISGFLNLVSGMGANDTAIFLSPIVEEFMKLLPLLLAMLLLDREGAALTMTAVSLGAGFATFENCCYILSSGAESLGYIMVRGMAVGVMHIVSVLALAMGLEAARRFRMLSFSSVAGALSLSTTFHALYNLLVSEPGISTAIGYALPALAAAAMIYPYRALRRRSE